MKRCTALTDHSAQPCEPNARGKARTMKSSMKLRRGLAIFAALLLALLVGAGGGNSARAYQSVGTKLHIDFMAVNSIAVTASQRLGNAFVDIKDELGNPVDGALVTGNWSGCVTQNGDSGTTAPYTASDGTIVDGRAFVVGNKKTTCVLKGKSCQLIFTVTSVTKSGYVYDPSANAVSSTFSGLCM